MTRLQIIEQRELLGKDFKIYGDIENPLFLAKDVADWIQHSKVSMMLKSIDEDEKVKVSNLYPGSNQESWFLTEDGLYEVLMQSRKPIAKKFKKQVKLILKDIRKHGAYLTDNKIEEVLLSPDTIINLATQLKEERQLNEKLQVELVEASEKTRYLDLIFESPDDLLITQIAQDYAMGAPTFNKLLRSLGVQRKVNGQWVLYRKYMGKGYIKSRTHSFTDSKGKSRTNVTTTWTQKGREFLYRKLKENGHLPIIEQEEAS